MTTEPGRRVLLALLDADRATHWRKLLVEQGWNVSELPVTAELPVNECADYDVVIVEPEDSSQFTIVDLLEHCPEYDSASILPVLTNASPDGVINLVRLGVVDVLIAPFTDHEVVETVNRVAGHRNLYLENIAYSEKLEQTNRELQESLKILRMDQLAGKQVQKSILPRTPLQYGPFTISHTILPSLYLSGDFVGYNIVLDRYLLFYLADVSGHGASSAFVTILLRFLLRRIVRRHTNDNDLKALSRAPEGFMEHVNRQIIATGLEKHLTMFAGAIDMQTNLLRYSVASQMPMPVFLAGTDARYLPGKGKPLGMFDDAHWEVEEIALPEKFGLVVASDGLLEVMEGKSLEEKEAQLLRVTSCSGPDHEKLCQNLGLDSLIDVADDVSILTIYRR